MIPKITMRAALNDPRLFGRVIEGASWDVWRAMLIALMGEALTRIERRVFARFTGRSYEPGKRVEEASFVVGRRGGKDRSASVLAAYIAGCCSHPKLVPGERGVVLLLGADQRQAAVQLNYIAAVFERSPVLRKLVIGQTQDSLSLSNGVDIEVRAASFRKLRGMTTIAVICTELAFWMSEDSSNPDAEILNAVRPTLATTGGPVIIISSPYARRGELWRIYKRHFGPDGDPLILVAQGTSRDFNPTLPQRVIDRALERDPSAASAEYLAQFRTDIEGFLSREAVDAVIARGVRERAYISGERYFAFVDPSGGSADSFTLAIGHVEQDSILLDCLRETKPPFSPESVVDEYATLMRSYRVTRVRGDRYAGEWPREQFRKRGINYVPADKTKSELFLDLLPSINSGQISLLDSERLVTQLVSLERRTARSGKDSIDHAPGAHDDLANAVAGVAHEAQRGRNRANVSLHAPAFINTHELPRAEQGRLY